MSDVFISHISEEKAIADIIETMIVKAFRGGIRVFSSSNEYALELGKEFYNEILDNMRSCQMVLVVCSPSSVERPWINFEAGVGKGLGVNVVPLCHSGLLIKDLPNPLGVNQGRNLNRADSLRVLLGTIAKKFNYDRPDDFDVSSYLTQIAIAEKGSDHD